MKEKYKFKYEQSPISEIMKISVIEADSIDSALVIFRLKYGTDNVIYNIELID